ncbi:MAG TPA: DUF4304 domain-containing protein [Acidobacteriota bacterium]|nr:DUF4304 domain-containing protein [Acidobacteriota bacterium]HNT18029.1 DUF4304 domain-containing protein [Acidobacteriota bacterium]
MRNECGVSGIQQEPFAKMSKIVKEHLAPTLKEYGYRKRNLTWNMKKNQFIHVINIQSSRWNNKNEVNFTINLGVFSPVVDSICSRDSKSFILESDCIIRKRIENLDGEGELWFLITNETNLNELGETIKQYLVNHAIPFLERFATLNDIHLWLSQKRRRNSFLPSENINYAVVKKILGMQEEGNSILREYDSENNPWKKNVVEIMKKFG